MILGLGLAWSATAQPRLASGTRIGGASAPAKVVTVRPYAYHPYAYNYRFGYRPFYSPYYGYNAFFYSPYAAQPSGLDLEIEQINNDYHQQIADVRHDATLTRAERRQQIRDLRHEKENSIIAAKEKYYHVQQ